MTTTEPEWAPDEVAQHLHVMRENIGSHGVPMDVAMDPANRGRFQVDAAVDFVALQLANEQKAYRDAYGHQGTEYLDSLRWTARLKPDDDLT